MYGNANVYEMRMPAHYVDMTADEMEYDGGWNWFKSIVKAVVVTVIAVAVVAAISASTVATGGAAALPSTYILTGIGAAAASLASDAIDEWM